MTGWRQTPGIRTGGSNAKTIYKGFDICSQITSQKVAPIFITTGSMPFTLPNTISCSQIFAYMLSEKCNW